MDYSWTIEEESIKIGSRTVKKGDRVRFRRGITRKDLEDLNIPRREAQSLLHAEHLTVVSVSNDSDSLYVLAPLGSVPWWVGVEDMCGDEAYDTDGEDVIPSDENIDILL